jgi:hypothetical protein
MWRIATTRQFSGLWVEHDNNGKFSLVIFNLHLVRSAKLRWRKIAMPNQAVSNQSSASRWIEFYQVVQLVSRIQGLWV